MLLNKSSVFIRVVGERPDSFAFTISEGDYIAFDAANFYRLEQGDPSIVFDPSTESIIGSGNMSVSSLTSSAKYPVMSYPIKADKYGKYYGFIRVKSETSSFSYDIIIDGITYSENQQNLVPGEWSWVPFSIVIKDNKVFDFSVKIKTENSKIDAFLISAENSIPDNIIHNSKYITLHYKMYQINDNFSIQDSIPIYGYKTTVEEISKDNWYNYSLDPLPGYSQVDFVNHYAAALFASGSSNTFYLVWDYASEQELDPYNPSCSIFYNDSTSDWEVDYSKRYAIRFYSFRDSINKEACKIIVPASALANNTINDFRTKVKDSVFLQTKIVDIDDSTNKVQLNLSDKLISIILDQSGSMTWNDSEGLRHDVVKRMIDRVQFTYPGDVRYNLLSFGATPIKLNFFAVVENDQINTSNASDVSSSFFSDQESGYAGVRVIRKKGGYPTSPLDGDVVTEGFFERAFDDNLEENSQYYYAVYTFNSDGVFSNGKFLKATPRVKINPKGVGGFTYRLVSGSGVKRDQNTIGLWHIDESYGNCLYDFSDNPFQLYSEEQNLVWLNSSDTPSGISGLRFNGVNSFSSYDEDGKFVKSKYTIMAWVYPFDFNQKRTIISRESNSSDKLSFRFGTNTNGTLFFTLNNSVNAISNNSIISNSWNHVAVTVDTISLSATFYINGEQSGSGSISSSGNYSQEPMHLFLGGKNSVFFGKITEVSVHDSIRSSSYIYGYSVRPENNSNKILDNGDRNVIIKYSVPEDYNYPGGKIRIIRKEEAGPANLYYKDSSIVSDGFGEKPSNEEDGDIVYEEDPSPGDFTVVFPYNYIHGRVYNYRIYSKNIIGNYSLDSDSPVLSIKIPYFESIEDRDNAVVPNFINSVQNVSIIPGNSKAYLRWDAANDSSVEQISVYWSDTGFPIINRENSSSSSLLVFSGNSSDTGFVDRNIENGLVNYYAVVASDRYGNISEPVYVSVIPSSDADESVIPLLDIKSFRYEIVNENAISLAWDSPVKFQKEIDAWFDQRIALYAQITDDFGNTISDISNMSFSVSAEVEAAELAEDVFGEIIDTSVVAPKAEDCYIISSTVIGNGLIRGVFRMTPNLDILSSINYLSAKIKVKYEITDQNNTDNNVFEFSSLPISIEMRNPFSMELINIGDNSANFGSITSSKTKKKKRRRTTQLATDPVSDNSETISGDFVKVLCKQTVPLDSQEFISSGGQLFDPDKYKEFNGCWIRRSRPFMARVVVSYRGQSLPLGGNCNAAVFEASDPQCDPDESDGRDPCSQSDGSSQKPKFVPSFSTRRSRSVQPPSTSIPLRTGVQLLSDGTTRTVTYVDIPLRSPRTPQSVMLFTKVGFNGYYARKKMYIVFENILRVETTIESPESNCIDVAEQIANVYLIDPDSPNIDRPLRTAVPNNQIVRWTIRKGRNGKDRPFYSADNVPSGPGVFSYTRGGSARKVFFGPACGVSWELYIPCPGNVVYLPELYAIKASVVYDGLSAFEEKPAIIYPSSVSNGFGSRFLMDMPQYVNTMYADGYSLVRCTVYHDPTLSSSPNASCFVQCAENANRPVFVLSSGQIVEIESGDNFEILYGDNSEIIYDEDIDEYVVINANIANGFAQIPLSQTSNSTTFYLRINKAIGNESSGQNSEESSSANSCSCIEVPSALSKKKNLSIINGRTSVNFNGETRYLRGGGDLKTGIPPTTIDLKEPLQIRVVDIRRGGASVEEVLCDGISVHEFVLEITFSGKPVPNGVPVFLSTGGPNSDKIILQNNVIYTNKINDSLLNPEGNVRSFCSFFVAPFEPSSAFECQVQAETNYDKRGDVSRSSTCCVSIKYDPSQVKDKTNKEPEGVVSNVFSSALNVYDTYTDEWLVKNSMPNPRGCFTLDWDFDAYNERLFAIGGINGKSILSYNEMYDIGSDTWLSRKSMNIPRFYHMSAQDYGFIYIFGGITSNGSDLFISNTVERYDIANDSWETVSQMPVIDQDSYGIAMGSCIIEGGKAYIIGGINRIGNKGRIESTNDRILVFDFDTHEWSWSEKLEYNLSILPFVFVESDGSYIHVLGGARLGDEDAITGEQSLEFTTNSYRINITDLSVEIDDYLYSKIPAPRYRGGFASIVDQHYFFGGSNELSQVLNVSEVITEGSPVYSYAKIKNMPKAKSGFGCASDNWRYIYSCGGLTSGRPDGFLQIKSKVSPSVVRLDGKQSATVSIELLDEVGERPEKDIRVLVQGILLFPNSQYGNSANDGGDQSQQDSDNSVRSALVYPVIFSSNDFYISNGIGSTIMLPRSEDILQKVSEIKNKLGINEFVPGEGGSEISSLVINEGEIRSPYSIRVRITVIDDFYYGQTVVDVKDNEDTNSTVTENGSTGSVQENTDVSGPAQAPGEFTRFEGCRSVEGTQVIEQPSQPSYNPGRDSENNQTIDQSLRQSGSSVFSLNPPQTPQLASPSISYFSDIEWLPQVNIHVNNGEYSDLLRHFYRLRNDIPFGASPLFDALVKNSSIMLDDSLDKYSKVIYLNTDNEESLSINNLQTAIDEVQSVDGFGRVPVVINNFSVVFPITLSALLSRTDTDSLNSIANETGGQSQTVLDSSYIDIVVNDSIGRVEGSIGWGVYECVVDLGKNSIINSISLEYELYPNTNGSWKISTSEDGFNYTEYSEEFDPNMDIDFVNINGRYIKFEITLLSGLSYYESSEYDLIPTPGAPSVNSINIIYSVPTESFIYLNDEKASYSPQQIAVAVSANKTNLSSIQVGATTSNSYNWIDYVSGSQPSVEQYGKLFIPIRYDQGDSSLKEPLESINGFMWKAKYGKWDEGSAVTILDKDSNIISSEKYRCYANDGLIVFSSKQLGPFTISIENSGNLRVGVRILNMDSNNPVEINGISYMYNSNVSLPPPLSQRPPVVSEFLITPSSVTTYQKIGISYKYFDINQNVEDLSNTVIKWYINGVEIEYLRNMRSWNNISDIDDPIWVYALSFRPEDVPEGTSYEQFARERGESIIKAGDVIYATIKASDGYLFSDTIRSSSRTVIESPPFINSVTIKGKTNSGITQASVTTNTRAFADFSYFQDSNGISKSKIIWYVNGIEFKRGDLGSVVGGISNNEIIPGEIKNNIVGISIGNVLEVTIVPSSQNIIGNPVTSAAVSVENSPPSVRNVSVSPGPTASSVSSLQLIYTYVDSESQQGSSQSDQSSIRWFRALRGSSTFEEVSSLQNVRIVPAVNTASGQRWKAEVIPFDGLSVGLAVESNIVEII